MKHNFNKNLLISIALFLSFGLYINSLSLSSKYTIESIKFGDVSLIPGHDLNKTLTSQISLVQDHRNLTPSHGIQFSCQLMNSYTYQYKHHIEGIRVGLTPQELRNLAMQRQEERMLALDNVCAVENPEYVLPLSTTKTFLNELKTSLIVHYNKKASCRATRQSTLLKLDAQIKFVDALLSDKVARLLE